MHVTEEQIKAALEAHEPSHGKICVHYVDTKPVGVRFDVDEMKWGVIGRMIGHTKDDPIATIDFLMSSDQLEDTIATLVATGITIEIAGINGAIDVTDIVRAAEGEETAP